jgi:lysophospholipase L1-like esterase
MFRFGAYRSILVAALILVSLTSSRNLQNLWAAESDDQKWESEITAYEAADKTNPPPKDAILFLGSSSIKLWQSLAHDFPEYKVINRGFGGSHLADCISVVDRIVIPYRPRIILLYAGDNDIAEGETPEQIFSDFKTFVQKVHAALPKTQIAYVSIKPSIDRRSLLDHMKLTNRLIEAYTQREKNTLFIDVFTPMLNKGEPRKELFDADGLHLNGAGYQLWASIIRPYLNK